MMCPIVFGDDVMHINEWAGLNVKIWKCSFFTNRMIVLFHIWCNNVVSFGSDAASIRNLCGPVGVGVYVCVYVCVGMYFIQTVDVEQKRSPVHG